MAVQTALGGYQSIYELTAPDGRLTRQRNYLYERLTSIKGISCVKPSGALYLFPGFDRKLYPVANDEEFVLEMLKHTHVLAVQGSGFNWVQPDHMRLVFLPDLGILETAADRMEAFFNSYRKKN